MAPTSRIIPALLVRWHGVNPIGCAELAEAVASAGGAPEGGAVLLDSGSSEASLDACAANWLAAQGVSVVGFRGEASADAQAVLRDAGLEVACGLNGLSVLPSGSRLTIEIDCVVPPR